MSLRFIDRDGKKILQEWVKASMKDPLVSAWEDVPIYEEPKEPEYLIAYGYRGASGKGISLVSTVDCNTRLIDERLVEKLAQWIESVEHQFLSPIMVLKEYRKHVPKREK